MSRNPYCFESQEPALRQSVFVFMDILGYSALIQESEEKDTQQEMLQKLHRALDGGRAWLENRDLRSELRELSEKDNYALKAFTDNIVIGWPVHNDAEAEFGTAFAKLAMFQQKMVSEGFFIRGAISVGLAYIDEITVFGNALTEAYKGESTMARDPRIILTKSAVSAAKRHLKYYGNPRHAPHTRDILCDSDGQWFLNYLDCILIAEDEYGPFYDELIKHKVAVEGQLVKHKGNPAIWSKYAWVAGYHNYFCDLHPHFFGDEHKIEVELFRASPTLIV